MQRKVDVEEYLKRFVGEEQYLYDIMKIKKETSNLFQSEDLTQ